MAKAARNAAILLTLALGAAACSRGGEVSVPTDPGFSGTAGTLGGDPLGGAGGAFGGAGGPASASFLPGSQISDRVFFTVDQVTLNPQAIAVLNAQIGWLRANPSAPILIEGHADERGTRDYNIALGERRANAAKNYLASLGIDPSRMNVISYGKERPAELGSNEEAWAKNRRAVTVVIGR